MKRREFIAVVAGATVVWPLSARAEGQRDCGASDWFPQWSIGGAVREIRGYIPPEPLPASPKGAM